MPLLLNETPQLESCAVQGDNVFGVQSSRQTAFLTAAVAPDSELNPSGFQLDPRLVGATSPSLSLDGRWAAFNAEARNGRPFRECLFDFHNGRDFIINTAVQSPLGTPKLSASGNVVLVHSSRKPAPGTGSAPSLLWCRSARNSRWRPLPGISPKRVR